MPFVSLTAFLCVLQLMLVRFGARRWLSLIIICWGIVATLFASLRSVFQFYALRLLLGVTESGTFPGMWFHMSLFYSGAQCPFLSSHAIHKSLRGSQTNFQASLLWDISLREQNKFSERNVPLHVVHVLRALDTLACFMQLSKTTGSR